MNQKTRPFPLEDIDPGTDWATLDSRVSVAVQEIQSALEEALAATRDLANWVERLRTLSAFMSQVESGLLEVRHQLKGPPSGHRPVPVPSVAPKFQATASDGPWQFEPAPAEPDVVEEPLLTVLETLEAESGPEPPEAVAVAEAEQPAAEAPVVTEAEQPSEPPEEEPVREAPCVAEARGDVCLEMESSEANIDLMVVERALRETPGVADVDLLDYAGRRARVRVTLKEGERSEETADPQRLAASVRERLAKLTWDSSLSVSPSE